jgi:hypothetical protein
MALAACPDHKDFEIVTAWRWICVLCGREIVEPTEDGMKLQVFEWTWPTEAKR